MCELQGSDSLASWQANLFFEPSNFEVGISSDSLYLVSTYSLIGKSCIYNYGEDELNQLQLI